MEINDFSLNFKYISERKIFCHSIGYELSLLRQRNLMTGAELGKILNISQQQISRYERGINKIPVDLLFYILNIFDISIGDFFERVRNRVITLKYKIKYDSDNNIPFFKNVI
ncbi:helix-turn-helix transcriptional regulator [Proteus cibarius]|uniref:Helix-turn-helix domain-containing protein n=1 Tax=Proteus terrae subsp. cibarius TaxID=626774 RepID=A0ABX6JK61_9GAMM|nr:MULTISPECIES: helix-turn-helix transcriptional regulator [Proteus]ATN00354.1 transcriptional regulator [Proteus vulgaris]MBG6037233.1 helix-turn-helix transcriptional regulator [Proteus terrae subsp. cibarius]MCM2366394.1 helix-turn-helix domain-containing protein [Proteus sp. FZP2095]MCT8230330.1 helix-turn-helix domain-containing protein [Proteus terrae]MDR9741323.1 helix-turn-helix transcriptional regulator [Proteus terrae]